MDGITDSKDMSLRKLQETVKDREDWRNREKWPEYEVAVDEMLQKTSTKNAPWYIIESNDKKYARIKTLRLIVKTLEKAVKEHF